MRLLWWLNEIIQVLESYLSHGNYLVKVHPPHHQKGHIYKRAANSLGCIITLLLLCFWRRWASHYWPHKECMCWESYGALWSSHGSSTGAALTSREAACNWQPFCLTHSPLTQPSSDLLYVLMTNTYHHLTRVCSEYELLVVNQEISLH